MTATKVAVVAGVVLLGFFCWLAVRGVTAVAELLIVVAALVVLVGGGNYLAGRRGPTSAREPHRRAPEAGDGGADP